MGASLSLVHQANACLLTIASNFDFFIPMPALVLSSPTFLVVTPGQAMGNDVHGNPGKRHYDIAMSRRTRKPLNLQESKKEIPPEGVVVHGGEKKNSEETRGGGDHHHNHDNDQKKSLKQLIHGDGNVEVIQPAADEGSKCRSSLEQHFTEEKLHVQLVVKQQEEVMAVGMKQPPAAAAVAAAAAAAQGSPVSHYIKLLGHLIKAKHDNSRAASRRKPIIPLPTRLRP